MKATKALTSEEDADYQQFTSSTWYGDDDRTTTLSVAGLGLVGEAAEVLEELQATSINRDALKEELGDVRYYWFRLCSEFGLSATNTRMGLPAGAPGPKEAAWTLLWVAARSAEAVKKHIRDHLTDTDKIAKALRHVDGAYMVLLTSLGLNEIDIVSLNKEKVSNRVQKMRLAKATLPIAKRTPYWRSPFPDILGQEKAAESVQFSAEHGLSGAIHEALRTGEEEGADPTNESDKLPTP